MNICLGLILSLIAGLSTLIGSIFIFFENKKQNTIIIALAFAAGVMSFISFTDLIPSAYSIFNNTYYKIPAIINIFLFIVIGIVIAILIDKILPINLENNKEKKNLYRIGIFSMITIIIHNIPEGMATFIATNNNIELGITLAIAIALHNIPEGISISLPIYYATGNKKKALLYTLISGLSEPLGAIISLIIFGPYINEIILSYLFSIISGIMIYISFHELLKESLKYKKTLLTIISFILGVLIVIINNIIL